jgi:hypothetical protein
MILLQQSAAPGQGDSGAGFGFDFGFVLRKLFMDVRKYITALR